MTVCHCIRGSMQNAGRSVEPVWGQEGVRCLGHTGKQQLPVAMNEVKVRIKLRFGDLRCLLLEDVNRKLTLFRELLDLG